MWATLVLLKSYPVTECKKPFFFQLFPKRQILDSTKLKEFADDSFRFDESIRKLFKRVENTVGKGEIAC